jgi:hypothetical protein
MTFPQVKQRIGMIIVNNYCVRLRRRRRNLRSSAQLQPCVIETTFKKIIIKADLIKLKQIFKMQTMAQQCQLWMGSLQVSLIAK